MNKYVGLRPSDIRGREGGKLRLLEVLRRQGPQSRATLGRSLGLSPASITALAGDLVADGILVEAGAGSVDLQAGPGRPATLVGFNPDLGHVMGLWVGLDRIVLQLADFSARTVASHEEALKLSQLSAETLVEALAARIAAFRARFCKSSKVLALGVAFQGFVDREAGAVIWSPVTRLTDLPLAKALSEATGLPVELDNDASAMAYAITCENRDLQRGITACIMLGDGVGMGIFIDGEPLRGSHGGGIEFGHIPLAPDGPQCRCGARGCVESYVADYAQYRDALALSTELAPLAGRQPSEAEMLALIADVEAGDLRLRQVIENAGRMLAQGVTTIIHLFQPGAIVFCGPGMRAWPHLERGFQDGLRRSVIAKLARDVDISVRPFETTFLTQGVILNALAQADRALALSP
ncbi:NagC Transcriptional regulator/sugar kinase [Rhabdaerophilaceae bacterium]